MQTEWNCPQAGRVIRDVNLAVKSVVKIKKIQK